MRRERRETGAETCISRGRRAARAAGWLTHRTGLAALAEELDPGGEESTGVGRLLTGLIKSPSFARATSAAAVAAVAASRSPVALADARRPPGSGRPLWEACERALPDVPLCERPLRERRSSCIRRTPPSVAISGALCCF